MEQNTSAHIISSHVISANIISAHIISAHMMSARNICMRARPAPSPASLHAKQRRRRHPLRRCCLSHWRPNKKKKKKPLLRRLASSRAPVTSGRHSWSPLSAATLGCHIVNAKKKNLNTTFLLGKKGNQSYCV